MQRIHTLIDKLAQQKAQGASPAHLLFTVQLLQQELSQLQKTCDALGSKKVAVTLPFNMSFAVPENLFETSLVEAVVAGPPVEEKVVYELDMPLEAVNESDPILPEPVYEPKAYTVPRPPVHEPFIAETNSFAKEEYRPSFPTHQTFSPAYEVVVEAPTLTQYAERTEVHERIAEKRESLNDRLKREQTELAQVLKESPIKDLRKGIGINDRFVFVRELFRGDEAAYERSIKTINNFNIYSEAEYWMSRELKLKLGWSDNSETVRHFYGLVRRRFS